MRVRSDIIGKQILSLSDGRRIGTVRDLYLDREVQAITAIFLGYDGLFGGNAGLIERKHVAVFGRDAILTLEGEVVVVADVPSDFPGIEQWVCCDQLLGRELRTADDWPLGRVIDLILSEPELALAGFVVRPYGLMEKIALQEPRAEVILWGDKVRQDAQAALHVRRPFPLLLLGTNNPE